MTYPLCRAGREWALGLGAFLLTVCGGGEAAAQEEIYVANFGSNTITTYPRTGKGDEPPLRTLVGPSTGLTGPVVVHIDVVHDEMVVVNPGAFGFPSILVYPRGASGDTPPLRKIQGLATGLDSPVDVAVDVIHDEMVVVNSGTPNSITVYRRTDNGDVAPLRTISGPATGFALIQGVVIDPIHDEPVVGDVGAAVHVFARTDDGNVAPTRSLAGPHTGLTSPRDRRRSPCRRRPTEKEAGMQILRRGSEGEEVRRWQHFLIGQSLLASAADGIFGPITERATRTFQRRAKIDVDGAVGPMTYAAAST